MVNPQPDVKEIFTEKRRGDFFALELTQTFFKIYLSIAAVARFSARRIFAERLDEFGTLRNAGKAVETPELHSRMTSIGKDLKVEKAFYFIGGSNANVVEESIAFALTRLRDCDRCAEEFQKKKKACRGGQGLERFKIIPPPWEKSVGGRKGCAQGAEKGGGKGNEV